MHFMALATDYDGTIAQDGHVPEPVIEALLRLKASGRRLVLVTGRELADLERVFPKIDLFDRIVAENGALLFTPEGKASRPLGPPPPQAFVERLQACGVKPLSVGAVIVATWEPNQTIVLDVIHELGLDLQIIFNKGAVMVLPSGINKASGLAAALDELGLAPQNAIAVGDAENDLAFMRTCGCAIAVANALDAVKAEADRTTTAARGAGVAELVETIVGGEAALLEAAMARHRIAVGTDAAGETPALRPAAGNVLIAGTSGGGKSTLALGLLERMAEAGAQYCIFDPEGDYAHVDGAVMFGDAKTPPRVEPVFDALKDPANRVVVNMLGVDVAERPALFARFFPGILQLRAAAGRPHWVLIDEAHHMQPRGREAAIGKWTAGEPSAIFVTVHPEALAAEVLRSLGFVLAIGESAGAVIEGVAKALDRPCPALPEAVPQHGEALFWDAAVGIAPVLVKILGPRQVQQRHTRKYAEGTLGDDKCFYFRGPDGALNLRAQNLMLFLQIAEGVDDATFLHHLRRGDYSAWFRKAIKDQDLAEAAAALEGEAAPTADVSRTRLRDIVEQRYTAPAEGTL